MFGGLAFLINAKHGGGRQWAGRSAGPGENPRETDALIGYQGATPMVMRGREMRGWLRMDAESWMWLPTLRG